MSEAPLLHSSLNPRVTRALVALGIFMVLVGAADVTSRLATAVLGQGAGMIAFAPVAALNDTSTYGALGALNAATVASTTPLIPARLRIPSIGIDAHVEQVGTKADGSMGTPQNFTDVAWYALGPKPGEAGSAVIAGHVNNALTLPGVFEHLSQVNLGDTVLVSDASGRTLTYVVVSSQTYAVDGAPLNDIFAAAGPSQLVLVSCDGDWVSSQHQFNERLVVVAKLQ
jgi:LPXTG-site transpeptidase (sortase) family protein